MNSSIDSRTPRIAVTDSRGLPVRQVAYWRQDSSEFETRVTVQQHDIVGRLVTQRDPRRSTDASAPANLSTTYSLSGRVFSTISVDAGWHVSLLSAPDRPVHSWDSRGNQRWADYDEQMRTLAVFEQTADGQPLCTERCGYGGADPAFAERNQCGRLIRHDDPAGTQLFSAFGLTGGVSELTRYFLCSVELPDWPQFVTECDKLLESGQGATSRSHFNSLGEIIEQTDAKGHRQFLGQTLEGQLREVSLQLAKEIEPKILVSAIQYNAHSQTVQEIAGNGAITTLQYAPDSGRLIRLQTKRSNSVVQDLHYAYDPVGNVLSIEDAALPIRYFANQRVEPINHYVYDSLYQLIKATGWEAGRPNQGPQVLVFDDPAPCANYTQTYRYDRGGNLLELTHQGVQNHGHRLVAAAHSNRCLPVRNGVEPTEEDFRNDFDANGNLLNLQPGQSLRWDLRNQLREVRPVERASGPDDSERYVYGADGMRVRKVRQMQTNTRTLFSEVRYLPNLEIRTHSGTGDVLQVISVQAGRSTVRVLHWESEPPKDTPNDQYRYNLNDHLGSCALELDSSGYVISQERYHPFGTTAWFAGCGDVEASHKTVRYSGKERDATGLYYFGFRYYVAWLQRWLNPDPAGTEDGLNLFAIVKNNPITYFDVDGRVREGINREHLKEEALEYLPPSLSGTPSSANIVSTDSQQLNFPDTPPSPPESTRKTDPFDELMEKLHLTPEKTRSSFISVAEDIGGRPRIAGGGEGEIYESSDGKHVYKKFKGMNQETSIPGSIESEAESFNAYYGAGSATALLEDNQVYLKMIKLDGIPLNEIEKGSIPQHAARALLDMFDEMEKKDLFHKDVQGINFLYSKRDNKVFPVDMAADPYQLAQYSIDVYDRNKIKLLTEFASNVQR
ncbi:RHS repeat protein [Pseudomonas sp. PDM28]|jgi:insecticidal toxin complex protein TccC|uniref:RHS repeat domain-containing protein n=1 Tax=Pseudomonas sp. PDM28 TaxID=2854770 RepID=UPI001C452B5B|nr:RHS repeat-associated core domain-containing protein [Pseudomonas sp. PDM28]MBV7554445.1 RHS repeat protein [Pseudomonas sp. PDM28]